MASCKTAVVAVIPHFKKSNKVFLKVCKIRKQKTNFFSRLNLRPNSTCETGAIYWLECSVTKHNYWTANINKVQGVVMILRTENTNMDKNHLVQDTDFLEVNKRISF